MNVDDLVQLMASVRPAGIEPEAYPQLAQLILAYALLKATQPEEVKKQGK